jgi:hypothetical protein
MSRPIPVIKDVTIGRIRGSNKQYEKADLIIGFDVNGKAVILKDRQLGKDSTILIVNAGESK